MSEWQMAAALAAAGLTAYVLGFLHGRAAAAARTRGVAKLLEWASRAEASESLGGLGGGELDHDHGGEHGNWPLGGAPPGPPKPADGGPGDPANHEEHWAWMEGLGGAAPAEQDPVAPKQGGIVIKKGKKGQWPNEPLWWPTPGGGSGGFAAALAKQGQDQTAPAKKGWPFAATLAGHHCAWKRVDGLVSDDFACACGNKLSEMKNGYFLKAALEAFGNILDVYPGAEAADHGNMHTDASDAAFNEHVDMLKAANEEKKAQLKSGQEQGLQEHAGA